MNNLKNKILSFLDNLFIYKETNKYDFFLPEKDSEKESTQKEEKAENSKQTDYEDIFPNININLEYMQIKYNALINSDVVIREFNLIAKNNEYKAFLIYLDGMVDSNMINGNGEFIKLLLAAVSTDKVKSCKVSDISLFLLLLA